MNKNIKIILGVAVVIILIVVALIRFSSNSLGEATSNSGIYTTSGSSPALDMGMAVVTKRDSLAMEENASSPQSPDYDGGDDNQSIDRLVVKTGRFSIVVKEVKEAVQTINDYAVQKDGYVVSSDVSKTGLAPYATVVIRIPAKMFDEGTGDIKALGEVESEYIEGQDVTEEYIDLDARLKNLRATEDQYLEIMKRAVKIEDILQVQNYLSNVRAEIESLQGRMKYLQQSADMSTITVYLSTDPEVLPAVDDQNKWKPWSEVKQATRSLVTMAKSLSYLMIWFVIYIPLWLAIGLVIWLTRRIWKKHKIKNQQV